MNCPPYQAPSPACRRIRSGAALCLALAICVSADARAWGRLGHEVAGAVAERYLSEQASTRVAALLDGDSLAAAGTWADRMRDDPAPYWQETAGRLHYVTVAPGHRYGTPPPPAHGDAVTALRDFARVLGAADSTREEQRLALRFGLHIVQDLHQPLHVGIGSDRGGNDVAVEILGEPSNLHRLWDAAIIDSAGRSRRAWLRRLAARGLLRPPADADGDVLGWIAESRQLRDTLYPPARTVDAAALSRHLPRAEERLALAGIRSAAWLNHVLATQVPQPDSRPAGSCRHGFPRDEQAPRD